MEIFIPKFEFDKTFVGGYFSSMEKVQEFLNQKNWFTKKVEDTIFDEDLANDFNLIVYKIKIDNPESEEKFVCNIGIDIGFKISK